MLMLNTKGLNLRAKPMRLGDRTMLMLNYVGNLLL